MQCQLSPDCGKNEKLRKFSVKNASVLGVKNQKQNTDSGAILVIQHRKAGIASAK